MGWLSKTFKKINPFNKGGFIGGIAGWPGSLIGGYIHNTTKGGSRWPSSNPNIPPGAPPGWQPGMPHYPGMPGFGKNQLTVPPELQHLMPSSPYIPGSVTKTNPQGSALYYDDAWLQVLKGLQGQRGQANVGGTMEEVLRQFKGTGQNMETFLRQMSPFIASQLFADPAFQKVHDFEGRTQEDLARTMQGYGAAAGTIGDQARRETTVGQNRLGRMGLGRGAASAALAQRVGQGAAAQQGGLFTNLYQGHMDRTQDYASQALDASRGLTQMVLTGVSPERTKPEKQSLWGPAIGAIGAGVGGLLGGLCWVAREVVPEEWTDVRYYMTHCAPPALFKHYAEYGELIAEHIKDKPEKQAVLRPLLKTFAKIGRDERAKAA